MSIVKNETRRVSALALGLVAVVLASGSLVVDSGRAVAADLVYGITGTIATSIEPYYLAVDESANSIYSTDGNKASVSVIDGETRTEVGTIALHERGGALAFDSTNNRLFVAQPQSNRVSVLALPGGEPLFSFAVGDGPNAIAIDDERDIAWVANSRSDDISVVQTSTGLAIGETIPVGNDPANVIVAGSANAVFVANFSSNTVSIIDSTTRLVTATVPVRDSPFAMAFDEESDLLYLGHTYVTDVTVIDPATPGVERLVATKDPARRILLDPFTNNLLIASAGSGYEVRHFTSLDRDTGRVANSRPITSTGLMVMNSVTGFAYIAGRDNNVTILSRGLPPIITSTALSTSGQATVSYQSKPLSASSAGKVAWSIVGTIPKGLSINSSTGVISGTPQYRGTYRFSIRAENPFGMDDLPIKLFIAEQPASVPRLGTLDAATKPLVDRWYQADLGLTGYPLPTLTTVGLPPGLRVDRQTLRGTPKKVGTYSFTITAHNSSGSTSRSYKLTVTGLGCKSSSVTYDGKYTKPDNWGRSRLRDLARSVPTSASAVEIYVSAVMHNTGHPANDLKKAKSRAYKIASYLAKQGVTGKRIYDFEVTRSHAKTTSTNISIRYIYSK